MRKRYLFPFALFIFFLPATVVAQVTASLTISGDITKPIIYTSAELNQLKRIAVHVKDMKGMGHDYSGVAVTDILKMAGIIKPEFHRDNLVKYVLVQAMDNYQVLFSMAELDSSFSGRTIILADQMDGKPLPEDKAPFRIVVPGEEKKQARWLWSVTDFIIRNGKD